ncbi:protein MEI2-like 4 [Zingiber officinale]|uniref:protein MEI2-like 4 n=1 Tax=Zingiber officinale TaxID=94328 RepID=UPI001C4D6DB3|nr:protein MEI2-like 4 [Zingiber officinale]XP_042438040.1 protein MEI2-like 4 [Zingiber officinale]XP_042438041.1 protein MEI2-like 4 [Zingiber officinale]XP_042438042.1 protein MEI2-like 4 [Zingiber officinale]
MFSESTHSNILNAQKTESSQQQMKEPQRMANISIGTQVSDHVSELQSDVLVLYPLLGEESLPDLCGSHYESGLFSSSLSDMFSRKLRLSSSIAPLGQSFELGHSNFEEDEPLETMEEIEAQTIGNLLPDDDELLSGITDDIRYLGQYNNGNDVDDDIFYTGGGMELEFDNNIRGTRTTEFVMAGASADQQGEPNGTFYGEHPYGEHPSRTLFVRNINSNVQDGELRALFEQYGDIRTLYTACKHRGFVMISYFDIRAAQKAMRALQNKPLNHRKLDIHFSIPKDNPSEKDINQGTLVVSNLDSSVTNDDLHQKFSVYGQIKEICAIPHKHHQKFIEFYDVRAAEAALHALNRSDFAGKKIKLEPSCSGVAKLCLGQQLSSEMDHNILNASWQGTTPNNSLAGCFGSSSLGSVTPNSLENRVIQGLNSAAKASITPPLEATLYEMPSKVPQHLSPSVGITMVGNHTKQAANIDFNCSLGPMNFGLQGMRGLHPHSLPNYHNGITNCIPYNSNTLSATGIGVISRPSEGIDARPLHRGSSGTYDGILLDRNKAFGISSNGSCPLHGGQYIANNTNSFQSKITTTMPWSNSPSFISNVSAHQPSHIHGMSGGQPQMLNTVPLHHHVGSAPAVNPSLWDRRFAYSGDSMESLVLHSGSLGNKGLASIPQLESLQPASRNFFPHSCGNCLDPCISHAPIGIPSAQKRSLMFHGRSPMVSMSGSFDGRAERIRSRTSDATANQGDNKKQYELDIECIRRGEDSRTTLMIKNIPNKYTSKMLLSAIDENHRGTYDFIYLPIDFKNKCNVGYAFINMINPQHIVQFYQSFNGKKWEKFNSEKVASLAYARIQGKSALIAHFQNSSLMNEDKRCRPILFHTDGPNAGDQEPFPVGTNIRSRLGRWRANNSSEENHQGMLISATEASCDRVGSHPGSTKDSE